MPACLHPTLLSICQQCYDPPGFDSSGIGWFDGDPGTCGTDVDSALVGRIGNAIVVAYRGTLAKGGESLRDTIDDWINNAETGLVRWPAGGGVHDGFNDSHRVLWPHVERALRERVAAREPREILVTGHSKGGALAVLGATAIREAWQHIPVRVVTFAAPRAGDRPFAAHYAALRIPTLRYENRSDLVPYLPLGDGVHPIVRTVTRALGLRAQVTGYVPVGEALVGGDSLATSTIKWLAVAYRMKWAGRPADYAGPLVAAHGLDGVYATMAGQSAKRCAQQRHAECAAALG